MKTGQQTRRYSLHELRDSTSTVFVPRSLSDPLTLGEREVHVWLASLRSTAAIILDLWGTLAADEKRLAMSFRIQKDCDRFIVARGLLRALLGRYMDQTPAQIQYFYNGYGKSELLGRGKTLHFNLSHSDALALFAFTRYAPVRVEIKDQKRDAAALPQVGTEGTDTFGWSLKEIVVGDNCGAAVAVEGHDWQLQCWTLSS